MYSHACREKKSGFVRLRHCSFRSEIRLYFLGGRKNRFCEAEALFFSVGNKIKYSWGRKINYSQADASNKIQPFICKKESVLDFVPKTSKQHSKYNTPLTYSSLAFPHTSSKQHSKKPPMLCINKHPHCETWTKCIVMKVQIPKQTLVQNKNALGSTKKLVGGFELTTKSSKVVPPSSEC